MCVIMELLLLVLLRCVIDNIMLVSSPDTPVTQCIILSRMGAHVGFQSSGS